MSDCSDLCPIHLVEIRFCEGIDHDELQSCPEKPEHLRGMPLGQYHCGTCGCMCLAGSEHLPHDYGCLLGLDVKAFWDDLHESMRLKS